MDKGVFVLQVAFAEIQQAVQLGQACMQIGGGVQVHAANGQQGFRQIGAQTFVNEPVNIEALLVHVVSPWVRPLVGPVVR